jgi:alpha-tubulin suppressor-like RCC1 family protein
VKRAVLLALAAAALGSCAPRPNTAIVLEVASDIDPVMLRRVQLVVRWTDSDERAARDRSYVFREDATRGVLRTFPASLVVAPEAASDGREAEFSLLAMTDGATVGSEELFTVSRVRARFRAGQTLRVPMVLANACGETSVARSCAASESCVATPEPRCVAAASVQPTPYSTLDAAAPDASSALRPLTGVVELRAGSERTCARLRDDRWRCWGEGSLGQLANRRAEDSSLPTPMNLGLASSDIALGRCHGCATTTDGTAWCFGCNGSTQVSPTRSLFELAPVRVGAESWRSVSSGLDFSCAINAAGRVMCWGSNASRQLGPTSTGGSSATPVEVAVAPGERFVSVSAGDTHACAISEAGVVYCWGSDAQSEGASDRATGRVRDGARRSDDPSAADAGTSDPLSGWVHNARSIHCANRVSCAVLRSGLALCWGAAGVIGTGIGIQVFGAYAVIERRGDLSVRSLSSSGATTVAIGSDGRAKCWGSNEVGQCGFTAGVRVLAAIDLAFSRPAVSVVSGGAHVCALLDDSTVECLGANSAGQLGNGTRLNSMVPQPVLTDR